MAYVKFILVFWFIYFTGFLSVVFTCGVYELSELVFLIWWTASAGGVLHSRALERCGMHYDIS